MLFGTYLPKCLIVHIAISCICLKNEIYCFRLEIFHSPIYFVTARTQELIDSTTPTMCFSEEKYFGN